MKNKSIWITLVVVLLFGGCKKYEDGPYFTLRSKTNRLSGDWQFESVYDYQSAQWVTSEFQAYTLSFSKENQCTIQHIDSLEAFNVEWEFINEKESILIDQLPLENVPYLLLGKEITAEDSILIFDIIELKQKKVVLLDEANREMNLIPD